MKRFTITNSDNQQINVDLVRYFKFKNDLFLIYTMNEMDEKNYIKLYLVRIMEELGFPVVQTIRNDADWALMQGIVKKALKEIKSGKKKLVEDLDYKDITGIKVVNPRYFKLEPKLADILASNYLDDNELENPTININESTENNVNDLEPSNTVGGVMPLEPIDTTIEKEGKFEPVAVEAIGEIEQQSIQSMDINSLDDAKNPTMNMVEQNLVETIKPIDMVDNNFENNLSDDNLEEAEKIEPLRIQVIEPESRDNKTVLEPIPEVTVSEISGTLDNSNLENNDESTNDVDYKNLYLAVKKENETSAALINSLMEQLLKYKEKYGNLIEENIEN